MGSTEKCLSNRGLGIKAKKCLYELVIIIQTVLRWFGHVERMDEYRMARRVLMPKSVEDGYEGDRG